MKFKLGIGVDGKLHINARVDAVEKCVGEVARHWDANQIYHFPLLAVTINEITLRGLIDTPIWTKIPASAGRNAPIDPNEIAKARIPLGKAGQAQDIAQGRAIPR